MPLNFQQLIQKILSNSHDAKARQERRIELQQKAGQSLVEWSEKITELNSKLNLACQADPSLRCAIPLAGPLVASFPPPLESQPVTLIAADGSQIIPDRHAAVLYGLVNVGVIILQTGSNQAPVIQTDSQLLIDDEIYSDSGVLTEEAIQQSRDLAERRKLLDIAKLYGHPVIALTDGPIELWGPKGGDTDDYRKNLEQHKSILSLLCEKGVVVAGYVEKPAADLVVRLLEIAQLPIDTAFKDIRKFHPLRGVTDRGLFSFLPPGHRSVVFGLQSVSRLQYTGDLSLHFFYLNVGELNHPNLVRVEVPAWVGWDVQKLNLLHVALLDQCRIMGVRPYPYILHRAHEVAVVNMDDKRQVEQLLDLELRRAGVSPGEKSTKLVAKESSAQGHGK